MAAPPTSVPTFEVERFEFEPPDRLVVTGQWFGVRGRRFVRPTLSVIGVTGVRPLLALLEHKPWAPLEGEWWVAAFPWDGGPLELEGAELAVAPDIAVTLPPPENLSAAPERPRFARPAPPPPPVAAAAPPDPPPARRDPSPSLDADHDAALRRIEELTIERDNAVRSRDSAYEARDAAFAAREELRHERDALDRAIDASVDERFESERGRLESELEAALAARDAAIGERDVAIAERDSAFDAREAAIVARKATERELDEVRDALRKHESAPAIAARARRQAVDWTYRTLIIISIALALLLFGVVLSAVL